MRFSNSWEFCNNYHFMYFYIFSVIIFFLDNLSLFLNFLSTGSIESLREININFLL